MELTTTEDRARLFANAAHSAVRQLRKYTSEPYIVHLVEVANIVKTIPHTDAMIVAAYLHDVVEDTGITLELIAAEFGEEVSDLVGWLTDVSKPEHGNRAARKAIDRAHTAASPYEAQTIKVADIISNTKYIRKHDLKFAATYLAEKRQLLDVMAADPDLMSQARTQIEELCDGLRFR